MEAVLDQIIAFLESHQSWAPYLAFLFAFAETLAFISIVIPSTAILVGVGGLVATGALTLFPIWIGASIGAVCGSMLSFWLGHRYGAKMLEGWPFDRHPGMVARGTHAFQKWGPAAIFIGHFFGPLRSVVFVLAGASRLPWGRSCWPIPRVRSSGPMRSRNPARSAAVSSATSGGRSSAADLQGGISPRSAARRSG